MFTPGKKFKLLVKVQRQEKVKQLTKWGVLF